MSETDSGERTEQPTQRRIEKARDEGQIARSRELSSALVTTAGALALLVAGGEALAQLAALLQTALAVAGMADADPARQLGQALLGGALAITVLVAVPWIISLLAPALIGGLHLSAKGVIPDLKRLDPIKGLGRLLSAQAGAELGKALGKMLLIGGLVVIWISAQSDRLLALSSLPLPTALASTGEMLLQVMFIGLIGLGLVAAMDVPFQLWNHTRQLRMSRDEIKREMFESEGRPEVKAKRRERAMQLSRGRMMEAVATADVVVTNPTHFAVALRYAAGEMRAPTVVAKGADEVATAIRERAAEARVLLLEAPPLARALFRSGTVGQEIPAVLYVAVAQVLTWAYRIRGGEQLAAPAPEVPDDLGRPFEEG
ncbi:flagellar type III secretion system protein FlhB [Flagellatimonas centrodinii]|uniref:EscU/YscU/HrcU family type III secretion system export apparatus switch protein n=1 Tax=Flagellatimonas centrodinii TaxID=2806210 RepID=UPI001FF013BE|nr:flagellar type III secretion system protein FlhB [Flagellatimonas centrodinii]ULQ45653.1 flagellar type III secretion system protein FlhB [Flagellatimonas centrodinii]